MIRLTGKVAEQLIACASERHVSQLVIGHPTHGRFSEFLHGSVTSSILRQMPGIDVHVIAEMKKRS